MNVIIFYTGCLLGSFFCVLGERIPLKKNWISQRSACSHCDQPLPAVALVPLLVFVFHQNKCLLCHQKIPLYHTLFELVTGVSLFAMQLHSTPLYLQLIALTALVLSLTDILYGIVDPYILSVGASIAFLFYLPELTWFNLILPLVSLSFFYWLDYFLPNQLGQGDIKLLLVWSLFLPFYSYIILLFVASSSAILFILYQAIHFKETARTLSIPFVPFLTIGLYVTIFI